MANLGFLAAAATAICWGSYMVPFKKSGSLNLIQFQAVMTVGIGLSGLLISLILGFPLSLNPYGLSSGLLWAVANAIFLQAVVNLGIARAVPIAASLVIILSFLWGGLVFNEMPAGIMVGLLGIGLIISGVVLIGTIGDMASQNIKRGLLAAVSAGVIWGSQWVPLKMGNVSTADFFFPVCLGIFVSGLIIFALSPSVILIRRMAEKNLNLYAPPSEVRKITTPQRFGVNYPRNDRQMYPVVGLSLLSGLIWNIGNLLSLISLSIIGLSKMGPISQTATLVAVLWGVFYFKEVTGLRSKLQVLIGAVILLVGVVVLSFA